MDVIETKPTEEIKIIDVNLNVDFDPPKDYLRKKREEEEKKKYKMEEERKNNYDKNKFPGRGFRLGTD